MKKTALLTATMLTVTCLGGSTLSANAAPLYSTQISQNGNKIIISYGSNCGNSTLLEQIRDCLQNIIPNYPGTSTPDTDKPENNQPDTDKPENSNPDTSKPGIDKPDVSQPDNNIPDNNKPENDKPGNSNPDSSQPGNNEPGTDKPENNQPGNNEPGTDKPENNQPDTDKPDDNTSGNDTVGEETAHSYINKVVSLVNAERAMAGLAPLTIDKKLQAAAQVRAIEIETSFSHTRPDGTSFATAIKEQNISYRNAGENIAWGQRSPEEVVSAWMNSAGHRANIMNANFTKIGVGYQQNSRGVNYWSQLFTN